MLASRGFWCAYSSGTFSATSHGKSAGDGAGGTLKRLATKASLQHAYNDHILTAHQLYQFAVNSIKGMQFCFVALLEHEQEAKLLEEHLARQNCSRHTKASLFYI